MREHVVRLRRQCGFQLPLRCAMIADGPVVVGQRETGCHRLRVELHGLLERLLGFFRSATSQLHGAERGIRGRILGIERDGLLHLLDRAGRIVQARESVPKQNVSRRALWIGLQRELRTRTRFIILASHEQQLARLQLRVEIRRIEVRRL